jgi:hypothetical protein
MSNAERLIRDVAYDTITIIAIWGLLQNSYPTKNKYNDGYNNIYSITANIVGFGITTYVLSKYM